MADEFVALGLDGDSAGELVASLRRVRRVLHVVPQRLPQRAALVLQLHLRSHCKTRELSFSTRNSGNKGFFRRIGNQFDKLFSFELVAPTHERRLNSRKTPNGSQPTEQI